MPKSTNKNHIKSVALLLVLILVVFAAVKLSNFASILFQVVFSNKIELQKTDDHVNILILGIGGGRHEGPDLTDTVIFSSISSNEQKITLVSIPRDLWSSDLKHKINAAYALGEEKKKGGGITLTKSLIGKITGQEINYVVVVDFSGFVRAVDMLGGVDVNLDATFDDYQYPIEGAENDKCGHSDEEIKAFTATVSAEIDLGQYFSCRYMRIHFDQGPTHMDGKTALAFVRSRHAQGDEGTDFARSKRQEKIIKAMKDKVLSLNIILNPVKIIGLYDTVKQSISTDIKNSEIDDFIKLGRKMQKAKIQSGVLDYGDQATKRPGLLMHPPVSLDYNWEWVLIPREGVADFSEIVDFVKCEIEAGVCPIK